MKKLIYMGMGLLLCQSSALWTGGDKPKERDAEDVNVSVGPDYEETAFGMSLQMVAVEGGTFMMGATVEQGDDAYGSEKQVHSVTLDGFYIGKYEVTQEQWEAVMDDATLSDIIKKHGWTSYGLGDNYPVYDVSWTDAVSFCEKLSQKTGKTYRLPTEAEWEYAARGGQQADGMEYAGSNLIDDVAWHINNSNGEAHPVGKKQSNALGLYDMSGNVFEWCQDWYGEYSSSPAVNPQGASGGSYRVSRGGGWYSSASYCRVSSRNSYTSDHRGNNIGFRVVCER